MNLNGRQKATVASILASEQSDFLTLARLAGLNPARDFQYVNLSGVDFGSTDLSGFDFTGSDLRNADLRRAKIDCANFTDSDTAGALWPDGNKRPTSSRPTESPFANVRLATPSDVKLHELYNHRGLTLGVLEEVIRYGGGGHLLTVGSSGSGKTRNVAIPNLLSYPGSVFHIDQKGDATFEILRTNPQSNGLAVLDPWNLTKQRKRFNPLDLIDTARPDVLNDVQLLIDSIVEDTGDKHFSGIAKELLTLLVLHVITAAEENNNERSLVNVRTLLMQSNAYGADKTDSVWEKLSDNASFDGMIARGATRMASLGKRELSSVMAVAVRSTDFLESSIMQDQLSRTEFDWASWFDKPLKVMTVLPAEYAQAQRGWSRLMLTAALLLLRRDREKTSRHQPVLFMLDDFPSLGRLDLLTSTYPMGQALGAQFWLMCQSMAQIRSDYESNIARILDNTDVFQVFDAYGSFDSDLITLLLERQDRNISADFASRSGDESLSARWPFSNTEVLLVVKGLFVRAQRFVNKYSRGT